MKNKNSNWSRMLTNCIIVFMSVLIGLSVCELILRLENGTFWLEKPVFSKDINGRNYGFWQGSEAEIAKILSMDKSIVLVGDSFVAGQGCVESNGNLSGHLKKLIKDPEVGVVNLGVGATNPAHYFEILNAFDIGQGSDVLVLFYDNDIVIDADSCQLIQDQARDNKIYVPSFCENLKVESGESLKLLSSGQTINQSLNDFHIWWIFKNSLYNVPITREFFNRTSYLEGWLDVNREETKWIMSMIPIMKSKLEGRGARIIFGYYPNTNNIHVDDPRHQTWMSFNQEIKKRYNVNILDPYPFLVKNATKRSMVRSVVDKHPSCEAHGIIAEFYLKYFKAEKGG